MLISLFSSFSKFSWRAAAPCRAYLERSSLFWWGGSGEWRWLVLTPFKLSSTGNPTDESLKKTCEKLGAGLRLTRCRHCFHYFLLHTNAAHIFIYFFNKIGFVIFQVAPVPLQETRSAASQKQNKKKNTRVTELSRVA